MATARKATPATTEAPATKPAPKKAKLFPVTETAANDTPNPPRPINEIIDELSTLRAKRKVLAADYEAKDGPVKAQEAELEKALVSRFTSLGTDGGRSKKFSAVVKKSTSFSVADRVALEAYATKNKCFEVFTNHLSSTAIADLILKVNAKIKDPAKHITVLPGTKSFEKQSITLTPVTSKGA